MKVKLTGNWGQFAKLCKTPLGPKVASAMRQAVEQEGHYLRGKMVQNITSGGQLAGRPFAPHSALTLAIRKMRGFGGRKILQHTGALRGSIVVQRVSEGSVYVGIMRGRGDANIGEIHEFGSTSAKPMTAKQRRFIFAAMRRAGRAPARSSGGGGLLHIRIPARPFISPVLQRFARPDAVQQRFWLILNQALGGAFGLSATLGAKPRKSGD